MQYFAEPLLSLDVDTEDEPMSIESDLEGKFSCPFVLFCTVFNLQFHTKLPTF